MTKPIRIVPNVRQLSADDLGIDINDPRWVSEEELMESLAIPEAPDTDPNQ